MQFILLLFQFMVHAPPDTVHPPSGPLIQDLIHAHYLGIAGNEDIEIAREGILKRSHLKQFLHQLVRIRSAFKIHGQLQAAQIRFITHIIDLADFPRFDQLCHLVHNGLSSGRIRDLIDLNNVFLFQISPSGTHLKTAVSGAIYVFHLRIIIDDFCSAGEIRRRHDGEDIEVRILDPSDCRLTDLIEIEAADLAGHADGNTQIGRYQNIGKCRRKQDRLLHTSVVVIHKLHGITVDVPKQFGTDCGQFRFRITGRSIGHIPGIHLTKVALGIHKRSQQSFISLGQTDHGIVDGLIAMRIEFHGLSHYIGRFGTVTAQQAHFIHGIQQFPV